MPLLLERLLGELPLSSFLGEHYLKAPLARRSAAAPFRELISWELMDRLVETPACDLILVRDGAMWSGDRPARAEEARKLYAEGYSLVFRHPDRHVPELAELGRSFSSELQGTINLHVYCTPPGHGSFGWHCDPEEVFILQTGGSKQYLLRQNTLNPTPLHETLTDVTDASREQTPIQECRLETGDWLYIPGGYWHMAQARETEALSISVGLMPATPIQVLDFVRGQLLRNRRWQQRLPPLGHASELSDAQKLEFCRELFQGLGEELEKLLAEPSFALRFLSAWARAGLKSSGPQR